jgi:hypothetical protein
VGAHGGADVGVDAADAGELVSHALGLQDVGDGDVPGGEALAGAGRRAGTFWYRTLAQATAEASRRLITLAQDTATADPTAALPVPQQATPLRVDLPHPAALLRRVADHYTGWQGESLTARFTPRRCHLLLEASTTNTSDTDLLTRDRSTMLGELAAGPTLAVAQLPLNGPSATPWPAPSWPGRTDRVTALGERLRSRPAARHPHQRRRARRQARPAAGCWRWSCLVGCGRDVPARRAASGVWLPCGSRLGLTPLKARRTLLSWTPPLATR